MRIREAELQDAAAMARVSVESYRAAHREQIPEESLMQFTYEESERNWARAMRELSEADECQEYISNRIHLPLQCIPHRCITIAYLCIY